MATNYQRGRAFERQVRLLLEKHGYFVVRSSRSKGVADLVALAPASHHGKVLLLQCKLYGQISIKEREDLRHAAITHGARPLLAFRPKKRGPIVLREFIEPMKSKYRDFDLT
jgi:Holliday junction resolvase